MIGERKPVDATMVFDRRVWETLALVISTIAAMLPVAGVIARWTRYVFDPSIPSSAVLAASIPDLVATGFSALWPGVTLLAIVTLYASRALPVVSASVMQVRTARLMLRVIQGAWVVVLAVVVLTTPFPSTWIAMAGPVALGETTGRASRGEVSWLRRVLPVALLMIVVSALANGITPPSARQVSVTFSDALNMPRDSEYLLIGETDQEIFLRPCGATRERDPRVLEVLRSSVIAVRFAVDQQTPRVVTFPEFIAGRSLEVGFSAIC